MVPSPRWLGGPSLPKHQFTSLGLTHLTKIGRNYRMYVGDGARCTKEGDVSNKVRQKNTPYYLRRIYDKKMTTTTEGGLGGTCKSDGIVNLKAAYTFQTLEGMVR